MSQEQRADVQSNVNNTTFDEASKHAAMVDHDWEDALASRKPRLWLRATSRSPGMTNEPRLGFGEFSGTARRHSVGVLPCQRLNSLSKSDSFA
jgi:hypothetical protein